eukprot:CAMPEP_0172709844 /NCGR_PEP_ID=MMETSP1074-20121228/55307_1 /TAXON_ID=2916 /ORGANISM="Ceratium fusus, Strain PA161109" /LENGTH=71 /DNA_ID=CAMNT_0013533159 /DNA_START=64 /DNA_END=276 /DNA_ORIENTATION=-
MPPVTLLALLFDRLWNVATDNLAASASAPTVAVAAVAAAAAWTALTGVVAFAVTAACEGQNGATFAVAAAA